MNDIEELLKTIDEGINDESHDGEIRGAPTVSEASAIDSDRIDAVETRTVAEWYEARCFGLDGHECDWTTEDDNWEGVNLDCTVHVAQTGHSIHIDVSNVISLTPGEED